VNLSPFLSGRDIVGYAPDVADVRREIAETAHDVADVERDSAAAEHDVIDAVHDVAGAVHDVADVVDDFADVEHEVADVVIDIADAFVENKKKPHPCGFVLPWAGAAKLTTPPWRTATPGAQPALATALASVDATCG
jgi:hypothetical protein